MGILKMVERQTKTFYKSGRLRSDVTGVEKHGSVGAGTVSLPRSCLQAPCQNMSRSNDTFPTQPTPHPYTAFAAKKNTQPFRTSADAPPSPTHRCSWTQVKSTTDTHTNKRRNAPPKAHMSTRTWHTDTKKRTRSSKPSF